MDKLKQHNTFGIDVSCRSLIELNSVDQLTKFLQRTDGEFMILGGGSNVLFTSDIDKDILLNRTSGIDIIREDESSVQLRVASGENWHEFVRWCVARDYRGIENMALIPGTVGAAPIQNIGAYGVEIKDVLDEVEYLELSNGKMHTISNTDCHFGYRNSVFKNELKGKVFVISITVTLSKTSTPTVEYWALQEYMQEHGIEEPKTADVFEAVVYIRRSKLPDPAELGNAGSFFKNPVIPNSQLEHVLQKHPEAKHFPVDDTHSKLAAGWMIEQCGWKGKRVGNTGSHARQALVLVNYGEAQGQEIADLAHEIIASVKREFGVELEPEVNIL